MADRDDDRDRRGPKAPKFSGKDHWNWSFQFENWAITNKLWPFYEGTAPARPTTAGEAQERWDDQNQRAFTELLNAMDAPELITILRDFGRKRVLPVGGTGQPRIEPPRPAEAWQMLESHFLSKQLSSQLVIERQLTTLHMESSETVLDQSESVQAAVCGSTG